MSLICHELRIKAWTDLYWWTDLYCSQNWS